MDRLAKIGLITIIVVALASVGIGFIILIKCLLVMW